MFVSISWGCFNLGLLSRVFEADIGSETTMVTVDLQ